MSSFDELVKKLDDFDIDVRKDAFERLCGLEGVDFAEPGDALNCHSHTFFSYNAYGYSPLRFVWEAKRRGLSFAGMVDFDVLDGLDEFLRGCDMLGVKGCVSLETRTFVPEFSERVINSPGEPGVAYHMGLGFVSADVPQEAREFLDGMRVRAEERNRGLVERVNGFLSPVELDYARDVQSLTPSGNATERHICLAYARKALDMMGPGEDLAQYWSTKLDVDVSELDLPDGAKLQGLIRARTMKRGGVGYVQPGSGSFPSLAEMNRFVLACGAIPALTWLDGTSEGEQAIGELLELSMSLGSAAVALIPDRNYTPGVKDEKLANLYDIVERAERAGLPVLIGTEMNSPGQKFVDNFDADELKPLIPVFVKGARIVYAHTVLQRNAGMGYLSGWAAASFGSVKEKNLFFEEFGRRHAAGRGLPEGIGIESSPAEILDRLG